MDTLIETITATGKVLSPLYIYKGEAHTMGNHDYKGRDPAGFALSKTGWTNDKVGLLWLTHHFEPNTQSTTSHPRLLIIDGHSSHLTLKFIEFCFTHEIQLLFFLRHSTYLLQPLDVGIMVPSGVTIAIRLMTGVEHIYIKPLARETSSHSAKWHAKRP